MYAIIKAGSKQHRVKEGDIVDIDLISSADKKVAFKEVLYLNDGKKPQVGAPFIKGCTVNGELLDEEVKGPKIISFKYRRRKRSKRKVGHRQDYSRVKITKIMKKGEADGS